MSDRARHPNPQTNQPRHGPSRLVSEERPNNQLIQFLLQTPRVRQQLQTNVGNGHQRPSGQPVGERINQRQRTVSLISQPNSNPNLPLNRQLSNENHLQNGHELQGFIREQQSQVEARLQQVQLNNVCSINPIPQQNPGPNTSNREGSRLQAAVHRQRQLIHNQQQQQRASIRLPVAPESTVTSSSQIPRFEHRQVTSAAGAPERAINHHQGPSQPPPPMFSVPNNAAPTEPPIQVVNNYETLNVLYEKLLGLHKHINDLIQFKGILLELKDSNRELGSILERSRRDNERRTIENHRLNGQLDLLTASVDSLEHHLTLKDNEVTEKNNEIAELKQVLEQIREELSTVKLNLETSAKNLDNLSLEKTTLEKQIRNLKCGQRQLKKRKRLLCTLNKQYLFKLRRATSQKKKFASQINNLKTIMKKDHEFMTSLEAGLNLKKAEVEQFKADNEKLKKEVVYLQKRLENKNSKEKIMEGVSAILGKCSEDINTFLDSMIKEDDEGQQQTSGEMLTEPSPPLNKGVKRVKVCGRASSSGKPASVINGEGDVEVEILDLIDPITAANCSPKHVKMESPASTRPTAVITLPRLDLLQATRVKTYAGTGCQVENKGGRSSKTKSSGKNFQ